MDEREAEAARRVILSGWITQGPEVAAFEQRVRRLGRRAARVRGVQLHDRAPPRAACRRGRSRRRGHHRQPLVHRHRERRSAIAAARRCSSTSIRAPTTSILKRIEAAITPRTRADPVRPSDGHAVRPRGRARGRAPALDPAGRGRGVRDRQRDPAGRANGRGSAARTATSPRFSFHPRKVLSTGDGGMLTTSNPEWDRGFRLLRQHGMSVPDTVRHGSSQVIFESYPVVGFNYRMTDIQAAVGREQLKRLPEIGRRRGARWPSAIAPCSPTFPDSASRASPRRRAPTGRATACACPSAATSARSCRQLLDQGIATRRGVMCNHRDGDLRRERRAAPLPNSRPRRIIASCCRCSRSWPMRISTHIAAALRAACAR